MRTGIGCVDNSEAVFAHVTMGEGDILCHAMTGKFLSEKGKSTTGSERGGMGRKLPRFVSSCFVELV
jgi:hypothetical protein